jgi:hypothetical protein
MLRREEMVVRSGSMGEFVFTPVGVDERLLREAGFVDIRVEDVTENMDLVATRWHAAREKQRGVLDRIEGTAENAAFQRFLEVADARPRTAACPSRVRRDEARVTSTAGSRRSR